MYGKRPSDPPPHTSWCHLGGGSGGGGYEKSEEKKGEKFERKRITEKQIEEIESVRMGALLVLKYFRIMGLGKYHF
jgi:hypothetical protein